MTEAATCAAQRRVLTDFVLAEAATGSEPADIGKADWINAVVPGGVHESLLATGGIEHPYYDRNEKSVRWIEERDWWYRGEFDGPGPLATDERIRLVFHGLDTVADVWLNGEHLGHHENMFRPAEYEVTGRLAEHNELLLRFRPPLEGLTPPASAVAMNERLATVFSAVFGDGDTADGGLSDVLPLATLRRKATCSWGWDFGPRVPSIGIWRPVELVRDWGWDFFHRILPETVERFDGAVPYWPGSPWGEDDTEGWMAVNGVRDGDRHAWEVWHGFDFGAGGGPYDDPGQARHHRRYANDRGKFISEFGIHAAPELATLERWIPAESLSIHSPSFDAHNKDHPKNKGDAVLEIVTGLPATMQQYVDFTMAAQAEGLKFGIEHYRRRQPHCSGTLVWQLNDVWPGFSWSVVDHDAVPKASWYALRRAFAPVVGSFAETAGGLELWVSNSTRQPVTTTAVVTLTDADGMTTKTFEVAVALGASESRRVWARSERLPTGAWAWVRSVDGAFPANRVFSGEVRDLHIGTEPPAWQAERTGETSAVVTLSATSLTYQVRITAGARGVRYSDNYVDLRPGDEATITLDCLPADFDPAAITVRAYTAR